MKSFFKHNPISVLSAFSVRNYLKLFPLFIPSLFPQPVFSKLPQELPLVALVQQEKISLSCTRLFIATCLPVGKVGARAAVINLQFSDVDFIYSFHPILSFRRNLIASFHPIFSFHST